MKATVEISATTGGSLQGQVTESPSFSGYIFLRKPEDLRVILLVPVLRNQAMDMVSDGKTWKLWIPPRNRAMEGTSQVTTPSKNGLENLRPAVFFDSLLVRGLEPNEIVSLTSDIRVVARPEEEEGPDRRAGLRPPDPLAARGPDRAHASASSTSAAPTCCPTSRTSTTTDGKVVTQAFYSNYQTYGEHPVPLEDRHHPPAGPVQPHRHHHQADPEPAARQRSVRDEDSDYGSDSEDEVEVKRGLGWGRGLHSHPSR